MSWGDAVLELWALALSSDRQTRLVKHGVNPRDLLWQVQPDRAGECLNLLAELPGQAVSQQPGLGHGVGSRPDTPCRARQAKLIQPWPQVFSIKGSVGAAGAKRKCQSSESVTQNLQASFRNNLQAICPWSYGKSVAGWKYDANIHLLAQCFNNKAVLPRYSPTLLFFPLSETFFIRVYFFFSTTALQEWITVTDHFFHTEHWWYSNEFSL